MRRGRALGAATLVIAIAATSACNGSSQADDPTPSSTSSSTSSSTPSSTPSGADPTQDPTRDPVAGPTLDPAHAVDPPGERTGQIAPADIVVNGSETLDAELVRAIERLTGVNDVEQISMVQVPIENRTISVAAVDAATYRNWVIAAEDAQFDEAWQRVARGELALRPALKKRAPIDDTGFLALGSTDQAAAVHVGAFAEQSWLVDAVVNETWIPDLDMVPDNALLIRTGGTAPDRLRQPIERILRGSEASVQMTDVVAREGLDPDVVQTALVVGSVADAVGVYRYRVLAGGRIAPDPAWVTAHIATEAVPILGNVTCNRLIFPQLRAALEEVVARNLADEIHPREFAGCYYPRFIAGSTTLSNHAFGLALDLNVPGNLRGTTGEIDRDVVAIFKSWGFAWGGDWSYTDPMHFEMNELVEPR